MWSQVLPPESSDERPKSVDERGKGPEENVKQSP